MSSKNRDQLEQDEDNRALWERPTFRRLVTKDAEGNAHLRDEGNLATGGCECHSAKNVISDARSKRDIAPVGGLAGGIGLYRYRYLWSDVIYVGVIAQEVAAVMPEAVRRGADGYLHVDYARLGLRMQTWDEWVAAQ
jgi:Chaperone of endosialidase